MNTLIPLLIAALTPILTTVLAVMRWRKKLGETRNKFTETAQNAANLAAVEARTQERKAIDSLLAEKDATITRLEGQLAQAQRNEQRLQDMLLHPTRARKAVTDDEKP